MDTKQLLEAVETLRAIEPLFESPKPDWLPVIAAIGGALVGAVSAIIPSYFIERKKQEDERRCVTNALVAEIRAILTIVEHRKYVENMKLVAHGLREKPGSSFQYSVKIPDHYSRVYQAHVERLGVVEPRLAAKIIEFHQLLDSVVQDIGPGGLISEHGGGVEAFEQLVHISESAVSIGKSLVRLHSA